MKSKKIIIKCKNCGKKVCRHRVKDRPQEFCSRKCYLSSDQNKEFQKKRKSGLNQIGKKNPSWKGDKVSYKGIHRWVETQLGVAKNFSCKFCNGKSGSKKMNWMNLDHKYTRDLKRWVPACKKCHSQYDQKNFKVYSGLKSDAHRKNISIGSRGISKNKGNKNPMYGTVAWNRKI